MSPAATVPLLTRREGLRDTPRVTAEEAPECLAILGPTGIGKSALALSVAAALDGEIVNADSIQAYRGLEIGTSKPSASDRDLVPHHLLGFLNPAERFSAGEFAHRAASVVADIRQRSRLPLVVGGNGFYFRALFDGLSPIPAVPSRVREQLEERLRSEGLAALYEELLCVDSKTAGRISPNDRQRVLRALEVAASTGRSLSSWQQERRRKLEISVLRIGLTCARDVLYDRLALRARRMLESGWLEEVRRLLKAGIEEGSPAFQAIGYRELAAHLRGDITLDQATSALLQATRRYAKRQLTWFRAEAGIRWFEVESRERLRCEVLDYLESSGLQGSP